MYFLFYLSVIKYGVQLLISSFLKDYTNIYSSQLV